MLTMEQKTYNGAIEKKSKEDKSKKKITQPKSNSNDEKIVNDMFVLIDKEFSYLDDKTKRRLMREVAWKFSDRLRGK